MDPFHIPTWRCRDSHPTNNFIAAICTVLRARDVVGNGGPVLPAGGQQLVGRRVLPTFRVPVDLIIQVDV